MKSAVFFDRDGILNRARMERWHQVSPLTLDEFEINEEAVELLRQIKAAVFLTISTTNRPGLSRGYQSRRELDRMHALLLKRFPLEGILLCPHDENDHCPCRRPKMGLLMEASFRWHVDLDRSFVVSKTWQDAEAARNAGCTSLLLKSPWNGGVHHDFILRDLSEVAHKVLQLGIPNPVTFSYQEAETAESMEY